MIKPHPALLLMFLACPAGRADAAPGRSSATGFSLSDPASTSLDSQQERITVWGYHRKFSAAPMSGDQASRPEVLGSLGPGSRLGVAMVQGGPVHGPVSNGLLAGLAIPVAGVKGLDFTASVAGTRDNLSLFGTTGAASMVAGFRLRF